MSGFKDTFKQSVLNHCLRATAYTPLSTIATALYTTAPTKSTEGTEVSASGTNYSRQATTFNAPGGTRYITNNGALNFACTGTQFGTVLAATVNETGTEDADDAIAWDEFTGIYIGPGDTFTIPDATGIKMEIEASGAGGGLSTYAVGKILDHWFRNTAWTGSGTANPWIALMEGTAPSDSSLGDECDETADGYERKQTAFDAPVADGDYYYCDNTSDQSWTATDAWASAIVGAAVCLSTTEETVDYMWWGTVTSASLGTGDIFRFLAGAFKCSLK